MSCQQLIQEDPYVFTDTISNSTNFMQQNNSQTKYVPLNRQTIYSRQFRQHEPSIASLENISINGIQHQKSPSPIHQKIIINASSVNQKKNGFTNGGFTTASKSPRTSPKFLKNHQNPSDGQYLVTNYDKSTHHSITVSSPQAPSNLHHHHQQHQQQQKFSTQINHVATLCENNINSNKTGINQGPLNGRSHSINYRGKLKAEVGGKVLSKKFENAAKSRSNGKWITKTKQEMFSSTRLTSKSGAKSQNVIVEPVLLASTCTPEVQPHSFIATFCAPPLSLLHHLDSGSVDKLTRDERLIQKKVLLRHQMEQFKGFQRYRTTERSKLRFSQTLRLLKHLDSAKDEIFKRRYKSCQFEECTKEAIYSTLHCTDHILLAGKEQHLIRQCGFLYSHGEQCRMPVSDILAPVAVCNEHQNAPANQLIDPAKPKKPSQISRKRINKAPMIRPVKKNGKNGMKKKTIFETKPAIMPHRPTMIIHPHDIHKPIKMSTQKQEIAPESHQFIHHNSGNLLASSQSSYGSITSTSDDLYLKQDLMTICENSYESSEDTGVGGLSENELMSHDVIGPFDMESCAELTKVLSSLPTNTLDDLLTEPLQTSRDDEEYLDRAIEEVSSVGMDQIAITAFDHLDGLDMLEMMDDEEQRQMISAATNLISMQGFLSSHDQDYAVTMPSPMMS